MTVTLEGAANAIVKAVADVLNAERSGAQHLYLIWGGWEKWLQGEILIALQDCPFRVSQEDTVYRDSPRESADFVLQLSDAKPGPRTRRSPPDTCVVELKAVTINQATGAFRALIKGDVEKLCQRLQIGSANSHAVGRLMIAVSVPGKTLDDNFRNAAETYVTGKGGSDFSASVQDAGGFKVYQMRWLAPADARTAASS